MKRRRFVLLSAVALLGAACGTATGPSGLRDTGTVFMPRETTPQATTRPGADATLAAATVVAVPTALPAPTVVPTPPAEADLIVPTDALPPAAAASTTDAEM